MSRVKRRVKTLRVDVNRYPSPFIDRGRVVRAIIITVINNIVKRTFYAKVRNAHDDKMRYMARARVSVHTGAAVQKAPKKFRWDAHTSFETLRNFPDTSGGPTPRTAPLAMRTCRCSDHNSLPIYGHFFYGELSCILI